MIYCSTVSVEHGEVNPVNKVYFLCFAIDSRAALMEQFILF